MKKSEKKPKTVHTTRAPFIQAKLKVGQRGDAAEREADRIAERVVSGEKVNGGIQRKPSQRGGVSGEVTSAFAAELSVSKGGGEALPVVHQQALAEHVGQDLSKVRVHTGARSQQLSEQIGARAFTHGSDIYFNKGEYRPETGEGKQLLAHEVVHTVQQGGTIRKQDKSESTANSGSGKANVRIDMCYESTSADSRIWMLETLLSAGKITKGEYQLILPILKKQSADERMRKAGTEIERKMRQEEIDNNTLVISNDAPMTRIQLRRRRELQTYNKLVTGTGSPGGLFAGAIAELLNKSNEEALKLVNFGNAAFSFVFKGYSDPVPADLRNSSQVTRGVQ